jgi:ABC-type lipoprotein export system ATPase subunit
LAHTIELKKVSKYYAGEDTVSMGFSRIDLNLDIGEFVAITGESGSGKSTLLNVISGLDTYEEGEMFVCGEDTTAYGTEDYEHYRKTYIGNIFQDFNLINSYTVYQNIELVMLLSGRKKRECKQRILELLELVGLSEYRRTKVSRLSGGQKQRVAIARALAKDAPIIVADEPTGNLDSASAESVMETLSKISDDKLVIIVTHNYEQAEPYVTRKLTMHDGKIIEDKHVASRAGALAYDDLSDYAEETTATDDVERVGRVERASASKGNRVVRKETPKPRKMRKLSELRLGLRNTFNLPAKFILLFIVYFFVSTAVISLYATTVNSMHQEELLGTNQYFMNSSSDRLIVKKADESSFSEEDFAKVENTPNIREIVKNDLAIDSGVSFTLNDYYVEGPVMPIGDVSEADIQYGSMPADDYQIVIKLDPSSDLLMISEDPNEYIGKKVVLQDMNQIQKYEFDKPIVIAGIALNDEESDNSTYELYGYSTICASDTISSELMTSMMASSSQSELNFGGTKVSGEGERSIYSSPDVPKGKVYIFEDQSYYYKDAKAKDKDFSLKVSNRFFESEADFKVGEILTDKNITPLLGIEKEEYDMFYNCVFINDNDFNKLYDKGFFQISAYMENETDSDETVQALKDQGFTVLALKDSLTDMTGGYSVVIQLITYGRLIIEFIVLFFIAYAVIRLIMRSRNQYYSTLRILGATKGNTDNILRIELILMMIIAYGVDMLFVVLVKKGYINNSSITKLLHFLTPVNYVALAVILLVMSLLIANRYSRSIFTRSAMKAFREGV